jgi:hypothetical protein
MMMIFWFIHVGEHKSKEKSQQKSSEKNSPQGAGNLHLVSGTYEPLARFSQEKRIYKFQKFLR